MENQTVKTRYSSYQYNPHIEKDAEGGMVRRGHSAEAKRYDELYKEYRKLAQRADKRMARLEQLSSQEYFQGVLNWSYRVAEHDIMAFNEKHGTKNRSIEKPRFNTAPPDNIQQLQAKVSAIKKFLEAPTSTKTGITKIYQKRANTVNERYGTNFTWQQLAAFYESGMASELDSKYMASNTILRAIGEMQKMEVKPEDIEKGAVKNMVISEDKVVDEMAKKLIEAGYTLDKLY